MNGNPAPKRPLIRILFVIALLIGGIAAAYSHFRTPEPVYYTDYQNPSPEQSKPLQRQDKLPSATYTIQRKDGTELPFALEEARTLQQKEQGLMFRQMMDANEGMIFLYPDSGERMIWMKNTEIPLDILFVDAQGRISHIHANAQPFSEEVIASPQPSQHIVELRGGVAKAYGITVGDTLHHPAPAPATMEQANE